MKKVILNLLVFSVVCFSTNALSQDIPTRKTKPTKVEKVIKTKERTSKSTRTKSQNTSDQNQELMEINNTIQADKLILKEKKPNLLSASISRITSVPERVNHRNGFLVQGTAGSNLDIEVYNKARWKQKGYDYVRAKTYDPIKVTSENNGSWKAKMEQPYLSIPSSAYDIKFEISSKQFPYDLLATLPDASIVYGTMAPPEIERVADKIHLASTAGPGGMYQQAYATISGKGIPDMDIKIKVATEYQTPKQRYNSGDAEMNTNLMDGETKSTKISSNGTWSVRVKVPNPNSRSHSFGVYNFKLVIKATQSSSSQDVSAKGEKKFDI